MQNTYMHYRCAINVARADAKQLALSDLARPVREWITSHKEADHRLGGKWFYTRGNWKSMIRNNTHIHVLSDYGDDCDGMLWAE